MATKNKKASADKTADASKNEAAEATAKDLTQEAITDESDNATATDLTQEAITDESANGEYNEASADKTADASKNEAAEATATDLTQEAITDESANAEYNEASAKIESLEVENAALKEYISSLTENAFVSDIKPKGLSLQELTAIVATKEEELVALTKALNDKKREAQKEALAEAEKNDKRPVFTDDRGLKFRFKKSTPKTLNIDGKPRKLEDIIKDKEVMSELIYGNSNYVEQKSL